MGSFLKIIKASIQLLNKKALFDENVINESDILPCAFE
jgi:hypothetical protein